MTTFAVVNWRWEGSVEFEKEVVEVTNVDKLAVEGEVKEKADCSMQYRRAIWRGKIHSLHEKKRDANVVKEQLLAESDDDEDDDGLEEEPFPIKRPRTSPVEADSGDWSFAEVLAMDGFNPDDELQETSDTMLHQSKSGKSNTSVEKRKNSGKKAKADGKKKVPNKKKQKEKTEKGKTSKKKPQAQGTLGSQATAQQISSATLVANILAPLKASYSASHPVHVNEDLSTDGENSAADEYNASSNILPPPPTRPLPPTQRPQVGMKTPKSSFPPKKCINVHCKEEKEKLKGEIDKLQQEIEDIKSSSSKSQPRGVVVTPSGFIDAAEASQRGLSEIAEGVWCCPVRVKALINSVSSRTALACAMLNIFYPREKLKGKRLKDLNQKVVAAITDFAVVAKVTTPEETEEGRKKETNCSKGDVMQALRQKCNNLIFQDKNPSYHKEKYQQHKEAKKSDK